MVIRRFESCAEEFGGDDCMTLGGRFDDVLFWFMIPF